MQYYFRDDLFFKKHLNMCKRVLVFLGIIFLTSCHKEIQSEKEVYRNDFESADLNDIEGGQINTFNASKVIGFYNNGGFKIVLSGLSAHELVKVSFDLYVHDTWAGNNTGEKDIVDGPDLWQMLVDNEIFINTTFSNSGCFPTYCLQQSYPKNFPFHHDAGTGASRNDLPGRCHLKNVTGGTSLYNIEKYINHNGSNLEIEFRDLLKQNNAADMLCDESWSMDNLIISTTTLN